MKSDNVMINQKGHASLIDFGSAQIMEGEYWNHPFHGTPVYAAPERLNGHVYDQKADVYSLGVLASRLITGRIPSSRGFPLAWISELIGDLLSYSPNKRPDARVASLRFRSTFDKFFEAS